MDMAHSIAASFNNGVEFVKLRIKELTVLTAVMDQFLETLGDLVGDGVETRVIDRLREDSTVELHLQRGGSDKCIAVVKLGFSGPLAELTYGESVKTIHNVEEFQPALVAILEDPQVAWLIYQIKPENTRASLYRGL
jgi:hypothetical protein